MAVSTATVDDGGGVAVSTPPVPSSVSPAVAAATAALIAERMLASDGSEALKDDVSARLVI